MVTTMDAGAAAIMAQLEGKRNIMAKRRVKVETATHRVACFTKVGITAEPSHRYNLIVKGLWGLEALKSQIT
jgi:hypothetical protein